MKKPIIEKENIMENKFTVTNENIKILVGIAVGFIAGFVLGAVLAPHHNRIEFSLFSGNGNRNRDNSAAFGLGGAKIGRKRRR